MVGTDTQQTPVCQLPVVLITGCSTGGIGHCLCRTFAQGGYQVVATARDVSKADFSMCPPEVQKNITVYKLDVVNHKQVLEVKDRLVKEFGRLDVLINNAGMSLCGPVAEAEIDQMKKVFDANVFGAIDMIQTLLPTLVHNRADDLHSGPLANRQRKIVNVGSVVAWVATPWAGTYCASKAALMAFTDSLRLEVAPFGVQVLHVMPETIKSNFGLNAKENISMRPPGQSLYTQFRGAVEKRAMISQTGDKTSKTAEVTSTEAFCTRLYNEVNQVNMLKQIVIGAKATTWWLAHYVFPRWLTDSMLNKIYGLKGVVVDPKTVKVE